MAALMSSLMIWAQGLALLLAVLLTAWPLGLYIARVMNGEAVRAQRCFGWLERACYRLTGIDHAAEMHWRNYALALLGFSLLCTVLLYATQRLQAWLPLNPQQFANVDADTAFNTAVSFVTNTNWQSYVGEASLSYFTQMFGLAVQHFVSAAVGIAVAIAFIRGLARHDTHTIGNFWVDVTRSVVYVLLPLSLVIALLLVAQGVVQNVTPYQSFIPWQTGAASANTAPLASSATSLLPMGPVASQEAIKQLGTNGGGFFNANSAHPFENPTPLSNALQMWALLVIPFALTWTFGRMVGDRRQGHALLITMLVLVVVMSVVATRAEQRAIPWVTEQGVDQQASDSQAGGNMEGKEVRFGINASALFATITTATSTGAVNSQHDSYSPIGGLVTLVMMQLGEVAPGGVGTGLVSMLIFALLAVFIAGLMIGRTPEYLGKKIEAYEMKLIALIILITPILVLVGTSLAVLTASGRSAVGNPGAHGFSEMLYAFTSAGNNNGSAFAGLSAGSLFYNTILGVVMWLGRFWVMVPVLAMAGSLAAKKRLPVGVGTLPTQGPLFVVLLLGSVLLVGLLTYVPALALGPVVEHLQLYHSGPSL